ADGRRRTRLRFQTQGTSRIPGGSRIKLQRQTGASQIDRAQIRMAPDNRLQPACHPCGKEAATALRDGLTRTWPAPGFGLIAETASPLCRLPTERDRGVGPS